MKKTAPLFAILLFVGCSSSPSEPGGTSDDAASESSTDDTGTTADSSDDTSPTTDGSTEETAVDTGADTGGSDAPVDAPADAPDWSKVNPIEGVKAADVKKIAGGFGFTEGTTWNAAGGYLLFTDIPNNKIHKLVPPSTVTVFRADSGKANGLAWDPSGRLVACEHWNRRVSRTNSDGTIVALADAFGGKKLNSPNDAIVRSDGNVYFTDPTYGLEGRPQEQSFKGVFRIDPTGKIHLVDDKMNQPNGVAFSPDEKTLYVADSASPVTYKWSVAGDGTPSGKTKFADSGSDGIGIDDAGNVYLTSSGAVRVYKPDGTAWGTIPIPEGPTNCAFGGADRKTLYVSARTSIYAVALKIPGKG